MYEEIEQKKNDIPHDHRCHSSALYEEIVDAFMASRTSHPPLQPLISKRPRRRHRRTQKKKKALSPPKFRLALL